MNKYENKYVDYFQYKPVPQFFLQKQDIPEIEMNESVPEKKTLLDSVMNFVKYNNNAKLCLLCGGVFLVGYFMGKSSR